MLRYFGVCNLTYVPSTYLWQTIWIQTPFLFVLFVAYEFTASACRYKYKVPLTRVIWHKDRTSSLESTPSQAFTLESRRRRRKHRIICGKVVNLHCVAGYKRRVQMLWSGWRIPTILWWEFEEFLKTSPRRFPRCQTCEKQSVPRFCNLRWTFSHFQGK